jgi:hypothetical protein
MKNTEFEALDFRRKYVNGDETLVSKQWRYRRVLPDTDDE